MLSKDLRKKGVQGVAISASCIVADESRIIGYVRHADDILCKALKLTIVPNSENEWFIRSLENLIGHHIGMTIAVAFGRVSSRESVRGYIRHGGDLAIEHSHIYVRALTSPLSCKKRGKDGLGGVEPGKKVGHRNPNLVRLARRFTRGSH
jgi:hypothetical protein